MKNWVNRETRGKEKRRGVGGRPINSNECPKPIEIGERDRERKGGWRTKEIKYNSRIKKEIKKSPSHRQKTTYETKPSRVSVSKFLSSAKASCTCASSSLTYAVSWCWWRAWSYSVGNARRRSCRSSPACRWENRYANLRAPPCLPFGPMGWYEPRMSCGHRHA